MRSKTTMTKTHLLSSSSKCFFMFLYINLALIGELYANNEAEVLYGDCGYLQFNDIDGEELTEEEKLALLDSDFEEALNRSEKCLKTAIDNSNQKLAQAGGGGAAGGGGTDGAPVTAEQSSDSDDVEEASQESNQSRSAPSTPHQKGKKIGGASAVCDAVLQGLDSATTDSEKAHFKKLSDQYQCKS